MADGNKIQIQILADAKQATSEIKAVDDSIGNLDSSGRKAGGGLDKLGSDSDALGVRIGTGLGKAIVGVAQAAELYIAGSLVAAVATGGAGVAAFAALVKPAFQEVQDAVAKAAAGQQMAFAGLTAPQREAAKATLELRDAIQEQSRAFAAPVLSAYSEGLRTIQSLLPQIVQLATPVRDALLGIFTKLDEGAKSPAFADFLRQMQDAAAPLSGVMQQIGAALIQVAQALAPIIPQLVQIGAGVLALTPSLLQMVAGFLSLANDALTPLTPLLVPVLNFLQQDPTVVQALAAGIAAIVIGVKAWAVAQAILDVALDANPFGAVVLAIGEGIAILILLEKHLDQITAAMHTAWDYVKTATQVAWDAFANAITTKVNTAISTVKALKDGIIQAFATAGDWLKDAGKKIITGLVDGIKDSGPLVQGALGALTSSIPQWKGPPDTDRKLLYGAGQLIMGGLVDGLSSGEVAVMRQLRETTRNITAAFDDASATLSPSLAGFGNLTVQGPVGVVASSAGSGGNTYQIEIRVDPTADRVAIGAEIVNAITAFEDAGGRR